MLRIVERAFFFLPTIAASAFALLVAMGCSKPASSFGTPSSPGDPGVGATTGDAGLFAACPDENSCEQGLFCAFLDPDGGATRCTASCGADYPACPQGACKGGLCAPLCDPSSDCSTCACSTDTWCSPGQGCVPLVDVGGACLDDSSCKSQNCGAYTKTCRVPIGNACTAADCDQCISGGATGNGGGSGIDFCSRACQSDADCNGSGACVSSDGYPFICRPYCQSNIDPLCPGWNSCESIAETGRFFCACDEYRYCTVAMQNPLGAPCQLDANEQCRSNVCSSLTATLTTPGVCTAPCATDADCGTGGACLPGVILGGDGGATYLPGCVPTCGSGQACLVNQCVSRTTASGATMTVCDPHAALGGSCSVDAQCASGNCSSAHQCIAVGGAPNGTACAQASDCASSNCHNQTCTGTSEIGDPCTRSFDCNVGQCCSTGTCC